MKAKEQSNDQREPGSLQRRVSIKVEVFWGNEWITTTGFILDDITVDAMVTTWRKRNVICKFINRKNKPITWRHLKTKTNPQVR